MTFTVAKVVAIIGLIDISQAVAAAAEIVSF